MLSGKAGGFGPKQGNKSSKMMNMLESDTGNSTIDKETKVSFAKFDISIDNEGSVDKTYDENGFDKNDSDAEYTKGNDGEGQFCPPDDL